MAAKKQATHVQPGLVTGDEYDKMVAVMKELAFRGKMQEDLVMRVANAGDIAPVIEEIKRRRLYAKKMRGVPEPREPRPQGSSKKKSSRKRKAAPSTTGTGMMVPPERGGGDTGEAIA